MAMGVRGSEFGFGVRGSQRSALTVRGSRFTAGAGFRVWRLGNNHAEVAVERCGSGIKAEGSDLSPQNLPGQLSRMQVIVAQTSLKDVAEGLLG